MSIEVILADIIGATSIEIDAETGREAVYKAVLGFVLKEESAGFKFAGYTVEFEPVEVGCRAAVYFLDLEDSEGVSDPIYFEAII